MFPREFQNWKHKMQVGTTINLCDQRPADSRAAKWRWNAAPKLIIIIIINKKCTYLSDTVTWNAARALYTVNKVPAYNI